MSRMSSYSVLLFRYAYLGEPPPVPAGASGAERGPSQ